MDKYYYLGPEGRQMGPYSFSELRSRITPETIVWREGMDDWAPASTVPELDELFRSSTPPHASAFTPPPVKKPDNWLVWSILSTLFCCLPLGVVAIVYSAQVDSQWYRGEHERAINSARKAKNFTIAGVICGVVGSIIYFILLATVGVTSAVFGI